MDNARRTTLGAALCVLICFFLPWVQVSCLGMKDSASGFDLARSDDRALWLVPILMIAVLSLCLTHAVMNRAPWLFSLVGMSSGLISGWLIYRERASAGSSSNLIPTFWTLWYWLGLVASLIVAAGAFYFYTRRVRAP
jgi:nitrate/nitrite transporter NarK